MISDTFTAGWDNNCCISDRRCACRHSYSGEWPRFRVVIYNVYVKIMILASGLNSEWQIAMAEYIGLSI